MGSRLFWLILGFVLGAAAVFFAPRYGFLKKNLPAGGCPELALNKVMRKLWADHVIWTRQYIVDALSNAPSKEVTTQRLLKNQVDIGNAVAQFYGKDAGDALTALLKDHILIAADLIAAAMAHDTPAFEMANKKWHDNAREIAEFLHKANPENWPLPVMIVMMNEHLAVTTQEVQARLDGKWAEDIHVFDEVFEQIMKMADELTEGIYLKFIA